MAQILGRWAYSFRILTGYFVVLQTMNLEIENNSNIN